MLRKILLIAALTISMTAQARHSAVPLVDPPPLAVPAGASAADVQKAILAAGTGRSWKVVDRGPGMFTLEYAPREFSVTVTVTYDVHSVKIAYQTSANMEYSGEASHAMIHPNYNRWVNNLAYDIQVQMSAIAPK